MFFASRHTFDIKHCETRACLVEHSPDILTGIEERTQHVLFFFATSPTATLDEGIIPDDVFVLLLHEDAASW